MAHWPYRISIETEPGVFEYGFTLHASTPLDRARELAEEEYQRLRDYGLPVVTIGLLRRGKIIDVFLCDEHAERAKWQSQYREEAS